jgi:hypothetical protein
MSDLFYHRRHLGDKRPEPAGLPVCSCGRTFQPTRPNQTACLKHAGPATAYADSALAVPQPEPVSLVQARRLLAAIFPERLAIFFPAMVAVAALNDVGCQQAATREEWSTAQWTEADLRRGQFRLPWSSVLGGGR